MAIELEDVYARYGPMVLRRCRRLLKDEGRALDAMHDVFLQLLRRREDIDTQRIAPLLMRIATNVSLNHLRTWRRRPEDPGDEALLQIADAGGGGQGLAAARLMLGKIFARELPSTGEMAVMHLVDGMTLEEVGREVGLSVSGVRKRLRTLRARVAALEEV